ncbi:MAG: 4-hydroxy-tetrahydrodipicolinate reductase [Clostridiales bacterium]|jgi:4-hydroxy-tetrahydrodipicolinate reductase|nr:4-hydroxy-tetrahydrodipicolinate reductase [Clostridiales bacterium]
MIRVIINGFNGKMGRVVSQLVDAAPDMTIAAGIDVNAPTPQSAFPVYTSIADCEATADVVIDFSTADAAAAVIDYAERSRTALVLCTTGLSPATLARVSEASRSAAILRSANMSVGVNLIARTMPLFAEGLADSGFDVEIVEKHHSQKTDAPSGTALMLADAVSGGRYSYVYDRTKKRDRRGKNEIGIHAVRGGTIVGEHTVIFAGRDEVIEITHRATSKEVFAVGAVKAARFLAGKPAGLYGMDRVMEET